MVNVTSEEAKNTQRALLRNNLMKFISHLFISMNTDDPTVDQNSLDMLLKVQQHISKGEA